MGGEGAEGVKERTHWEGRMPRTVRGTRWGGMTRAERIGEAGRGRAGGASLGRAIGRVPVAVAMEANTLGTPLHHGPHYPAHLAVQGLRAAKSRAPAAQRSGLSRLSRFFN